MRTLTFIRTLGAGAFGTVYLAEFSSGQGFRRQVAVKVIQKNRPETEMFLARIRDEARLLGLLQDDAILKVLDMTQVDGLDAVVMEYVEGADLDTLMREGEPPPPRALAELAAAVAGALSRAHTAVHPNTGDSLNVVHRDVKPANIMVTSSGGVKLLDFGVARARFDARESQTGQFMLGTLNYMAPEYIVTGEVSPAADIYGLALSVWEVAAGEGYGQPKIRQDAHERRLAERMARIRATHAPLVPLLEQMLRWNPPDRPTAAMMERGFLEAADSIRGSGLRMWASTQVARVIQTRTLAPDGAGLLGRTISLTPSGAGTGALVGLGTGATMVPEGPPDPGAIPLVRPGPPSAAPPSAPQAPPAPPVPSNRPPPPPPPSRSPLKTTGPQPGRGPQPAAPAVPQPNQPAARRTLPPAPISTSKPPPSNLGLYLKVAAGGLLLGLIAVVFLAWALFLQ